MLNLIYMNDSKLMIVWSVFENIFLDKHTINKKNRVQDLILVSFSTNIFGKGFDKKEWLNNSPGYNMIILQYTIARE